MHFNNTIGIALTTGLGFVFGRLFDGFFFCRLLLNYSKETDELSSNARIDPKKQLLSIDPSSSEVLPIINEMLSKGYSIVHTFSLAWPIYSTFTLKCIC